MEVGRGCCSYNVMIIGILFIDIGVFVFDCVNFVVVFFEVVDVDLFS